LFLSGDRENTPSSFAERFAQIAPAFFSPSPSPFDLRWVLFSFFFFGVDFFLSDPQQKDEALLFPFFSLPSGV